jgi:hypothetical protein
MRAVVVSVVAALDVEGQVDERWGGRGRRW